MSIRHLCEFFQIFERRYLEVLHEYKMSKGLNNGYKPVIQLCGCYDPLTVDLCSKVQQ